MKEIKIFYDLETTGVDPRKHGIHQIAGLVEVDGLIAEAFDIRAQPNPKAKIEPEALAVGGITEDDLVLYPPMREAFRDFKAILAKYLDKYDKRDKAWLVGYNNRGFDDVFLRAWFGQNGDEYFGSWFWSDTVDVMVLASQYLMSKRRDMPNFRLGTVAEYAGIETDKGRLHDAAYDVNLTRQLYYITTLGA